jgi:hypothetical protein
MAPPVQRLGEADLRHSTTTASSGMRDDGANPPGKRLPLPEDALKKEAPEGHEHFAFALGGTVSTGRSDRAG